MPAWDEEDCSYLLRHMELTTFTNVVTALRAQGILSKSKSAFLESARRIFFIGDEMFKAEVRRVANDENLIRIAAVLNPNYDSYADWGLLGAEFDDGLGMPTPRLFDSKNSQSVASALLTIADAHNGRIEDDKSTNPIFDTGHVGCVPENLRAMFDGQEDVLKKVNDAIAKSRKENRDKYDKIFQRGKTVEPEDSDDEESEELPTASQVIAVDKTEKAGESSVEMPKAAAEKPIVDKPIQLPIEKLRIPIDKIKTPLAKSRAAAERSKTPSERARASTEKSKDKSKASAEKLKITSENAEVSIGKASTSAGAHEKTRPKTAADKSKTANESVRSAVDEEVLKLLKRASAESERAELRAGQARNMCAGAPMPQRKTEHKMSIAEMNVQKELMKRAGEVESAIAKKNAAAAMAYKSTIVAKTSSYPSVPVTRTLPGVPSVNEIMDSRRMERSAEPSALRKELEKSTEYGRPVAGLTVSAEVRRQLEAKTLEARALEAKNLEARARESKALEVTALELRALEAQLQEARAGLEASSAESKSLESGETRGYDGRALDMQTFEAKTLKSFVMEAKALEARAAEEKALEGRSYSKNIGKPSTSLAHDTSRRVSSAHLVSSSRVDSTTAMEEEQSQKVAEIIDRIHRRRPKPTEPADKIQLPPSQSRAPPRAVSGFLPVSPRVPNLTITSSTNSPALPKRPRLSSGSEGTSSPSYPKEYPVMRAPVTGTAAKQKHVPGILQHDGQRKPRTVSQSSSCSYLGPPRSSNSPVRPQVRPIGVSPSLTISSMSPSMSPQDTGSHHGHGHDYGVSNSNRSHYRPLAMGQHSTTDPYYKSSPPSRQRVPTSTSISFNQNTNLFPVVRRVGQVMFRRDGTGNIISEPSSSQIGRRMGGVGNNVTAASVERMRERMEQPRYEHSTVTSTCSLHTHSSHTSDISNARQLSTTQPRQPHVAVPSVSVEASRPGVSVQANQEVAHASKDKKSDPMNTKFSR